MARFQHLHIERQTHLSLGKYSPNLQICKPPALTRATYALFVDLAAVVAADLLIFAVRLFVQGMGPPGGFLALSHARGNCEGRFTPTSWLPGWL